MNEAGQSWPGGDGDGRGAAPVAGVQADRLAEVSASPAPPGLALELRNVRKAYGRKVAVRDLSLEVLRGELFAFLGPNGAGKTTTIKLLAGLLRPNGGEVYVCGQRMHTDEVTGKARLAYVPDQPFVYEKLTGREFLYFVAEMYNLSRERRDEQLARLIPDLGVADFLDQMTDSYSHGMKQRVVLAAALLHEPELLIVDEPMVGLDPRTVRRVKNLFRAHTDAGRTIFMSTHTLEVAEAVADRIGIIHHGELLAVGTLAELRARLATEQNLEEIFLRLTDDEDA